ncbi:MAG: hypothetical protein AAF409_19815 [Pseudomonadota bacterium]
MGTIALVALIPQITELEQIEVLRALYALIIGWNNVMEWVGRMIEVLPFIPPLSRPVVSTILFLPTVPLPMMVSSLIRERDPLS